MAKAATQHPKKLSIRFKDHPSILNCIPQTLRSPIRSVNSYFHELKKEFERAKKTPTPAVVSRQTPSAPIMSTAGKNSVSERSQRQS
jgi:DNA mismatch repair ATPase MutL